MATYTTSLRLVQPSVGDVNWGTTVNNGLTALVDSAIAGTVTIIVGSTDYTLSSNNGGADEARAAVLRLEPGGGVGARFIIVPALSKLYVVSNNTGFIQSVSTSGSGGIAVPNGATVYLRCDGTNVVEALNYFGSLTLGAALPIASGGTGSTTLAGANIPVTTVSNTFTAAQTFRAANAVRSEVAETQDAVVVAGRAGGASSYAVTLTPTTLTANRTLTLPDATDTVAVLGVAQTFTATQTFNGSTSTLAMVLTDAAEKVTISATAATGTVNYDVTTQSVLYYTTNASANWTVNFRASTGTTLNAAMATGQSVTVAFLVTQGATAYYNNVVQVDGVSFTPKWQGGTAPIAGSVSSIDAYSYTIIKTGAATFTVLAAQTRFA